MSTRLQALAALIIVVLAAVLAAVVVSSVGGEPRGANATSSVTDTALPSAKPLVLGGLRFRRSTVAAITGEEPTFSAVLDQASQAFADALAGERGYDAYVSCLAVQPPSSCERLHVEVFSAAIWSLAQAFDEDRYGLGALLTSNPEVLRELGLVAALSTDVTRRLAALMLLNRTPNLAPAVLPFAAYDSLHDRSSIEVALVLERHNSDVPLDREAAVAVSRLIGDEPDTAVADGTARSAIVALGHPETEDLLVTALDVVDVDGIPTDLVAQVGTAVGRCGAPCLDYITRLAASERSADRRAAYFAMAHLGREERGTVVYEIEHATRRVLDAEEQLSVDRVLRLPRTPEP